MAPVGWGVLPALAPRPEVVTLGHLAPDALEALDAAGARVLAALGWDAVDAVEGHGQRLVVAAVPADTGQGELEQLAALLEGQGLSAVIVCEEAALEPVFAVLAGPRVELLCDPGAGDWAGALAWGALRIEPAVPGVRESGDEAERLRRLHAEVARIAAQLAALAETPDASEAIAERRTRYTAGTGAHEPVDAGEIRRVIRARRLRAQFFDPRLLEDPGWDMLLDLFAAELERTQVSVSSLCIASAVAPTTALRWISRMVDAGLMVRIADTGDRRRAFVALSTVASDGMRSYVSAAKRAGVGLA